MIFTQFPPNRLASASLLILVLALPLPPITLQVPKVKTSVND